MTHSTFLPPRRTALARSSARILTLLAVLSGALERLAGRIARRLRDDRGQATTEYALVLLAAALVALLVVAWATAGCGAQRINRLFNRVVDAVIDRV